MATHIKKLLDKFLKSKKKGVEDWSRIEQIVEEALDENLRKHLHPEKIHKNTLIVCSDSSSVSYEFNLKKDRILEAVKKEFAYIEDIKIYIGKKWQKL